jgi:RNA polymerase sigma factor (sigma-70 family)
LYRQFYPGLYALCRNFFSDNHDVLTALNNGMLNVFKNIGQYDPAKGDLFNWAYTIVRHAAINHIKCKKLIVKDIGVTNLSEDFASYLPFQDYEWTWIHYYLDKLPQATRIVCSLFYLDGFAVKEIAEHLSLSEGTVKWHLSESRNKLKSLIKTNLKPESA